MLPSAVMLIIDQLPAGLLGPYGNTMVETAGINRLASQSLVFDFAFADSLDLRTAYDRIFSGLGEIEAESILLTDDTVVANHLQTNFDRIILIEQTEVSGAASSPATTQLANFFAQATAWLAEELEPGQLCWLHSQGLAGAWDAPYQMRLEFAGEDDPLPPQFVELPFIQSSSSELDPDQLLGYQQAAAAQIVLIDDCLSVMLDELEKSSVGRKILLGFASLRGCGLGEHGLVGIDQQLHFESVQIPLMLRFPQPDSASPTSNADLARHQRIGRSGSLVSLTSIPPLLRFWLNDNPDLMDHAIRQIDSVYPDKTRQLVTIVNDQFELIQTHAWKLIRKHNGDVQLFAKPDDRWEINDVSDRCPMIVEKLVDLLDRRVGINSSCLIDTHLEEDLIQRRD
jgi:hypothetical protein